MTPTDHALALAAQGFYVFPLLPGSKLPPKGVSWMRRATRDADRIRALFCGDENIGIATGVFGDGEALLVVDVDNKGGKRGNETVLNLEIQGHAFPPTLESRTPTGGRHLFYRVPVAVRQGVENIGPGIDTRSSGGYVVAPGSRVHIASAGDHPVVGEYAFAEPSHPLADAPSWLVEKCGVRRERDPEADKPLPGVDPERATKRAVEYLRNEASEAVEGAGGDAATFRVAARVKDFGVPQDACAALMLEHWFDGCGWMPDELAIKVANAYRYGAERQGADAPEAIFGAVPVPTVGAQYTLASVADVIGRPPPAWLLRGILPERGMGVVYGAPGSGKTFLVLDVVCAIARGVPWGGRRVHQGRAVYVGLEGHVGTRVAAYVRGHGLDAADLANVSVIERQIVDVLKAADVVALARDIRAALPEPPALVVLDTLNRSMPGGDENNSEDMGRAIFAANYLGNELGCLVLFVHHSGKSEGAGARGHSSLLGAADAELAVVRDEEGNRTVETTKVKDGEDGQRFAFALKSVDLGAVRDHDPEAAPDERLSSCVVEGLKELNLPKSGRSVSKLGSHAALGMRALRDAMSAVGIDGSRPFEDDSVLLDQWQAQFEAQYAGDPAWRRHFFQARTELLRKKLIHQPERNRVALTDTGKPP